MKLLKNHGGVVAWHDDDLADAYLQPDREGRPSGWSLLLSCDSGEEVPEELKAQAAALAGGDAPAVAAPAPAPVAETPVDLATGEPAKAPEKPGKKK